MILYTEHAGMMTNEDAFFNKYETIFKEALGDKFGKCIYSRYNTEFVKMKTGVLAGLISLSFMVLIRILLISWIS